jgi:hypothetical protein
VGTWILQPFLKAVYFFFVVLVRLNKAQVRRSFGIPNFGTRKGCTCALHKRSEMTYKGKSSWFNSRTYYRQWSLVVAPVRGPSSPIGIRRIFAIGRMWPVGVVLVGHNQVSYREQRANAPRFREGEQYGDP